MMHMGHQSEDDPWIQEMELKLRRIPRGMRTVASRFLDSMLEGEESEQTKTKSKPTTKSKK
jgi:hypothetical protein